MRADISEEGNGLQGMTISRAEAFGDPESELEASDLEDSANGNDDDGTETGSESKDESPATNEGLQNGTSRSSGLQDSPRYAAEIIPSPAIMQMRLSSLPGITTNILRHNFAHCDPKSRLRIAHMTRLNLRWDL